MRAAIILALLVTPALAQEQLHSQKYYEQNRGVRDVTLGWCHAEVSRARMSDCRNAEAASNERLTSRIVSDPLTDPEFWRENPAARNGVLRICAAPNNPADRPYLLYCRYAASGMGR